MPDPKITPLREEALRSVAEGKIILRWPSGARPPQWVWKETYRVANGAVYSWLERHRLIKPRSATFIDGRSDVDLTDRGRKILESLAPSGTSA